MLGCMMPQVIFSKVMLPVRKKLQVILNVASGDTVSQTDKKTTHTLLEMLVFFRYF